MSMRLSCVLSLAVLTFTACTGSTPAPNADAQAAVTAVAKKYPDCIRLTVHAAGATAGTFAAIASTDAPRIGTPSAPEDLEAMKTGKTIVLDEKGNTDVTVPMLQKDGKFTAACGVTLKAGADKDKLQATATEIAKAVEAAMQKK